MIAFEFNKVIVTQIKPNTFTTRSVLFTIYSYTLPNPGVSQNVVFKSM